MELSGLVEAKYVESAMPSRQYKMGRGFEYRRIKELLKSGEVVKAERFYASKGICDIYYVKKDGKYFEEQCKYTSNSRKVPYISTEEFLDLLQYALEHEGTINVCLTSGRARKRTKVWKLN